MRKTAALIVTGFALIWAAPAGAHHTSCKALGEEAASLGQAGILGDIASGLGTSGPGSVAAAIAGDQERLCSP